LSKTELNNKDCVQKTLEGGEFITLPAIDNLPGKYGLPFLCENGTTVVVAEIRRVIEEANAAIPTIDEAIEVVPPEPEPEKKVLQRDTPVTELKIENVTPGQLKAIHDEGIETLNDLFEAGDSLDDVQGIGQATKNRILQAVTEALERQ
jgi:hypothetical protein